MPPRPKSICRRAGCSALTDAPGYCEKHYIVELQRRHDYYKNDPEKLAETRRVHDAKRGTAAQRGYDSRWARARKYYLSAHPFCAHCMKDGKFWPANIVDHIIPARLKQAIDSGNPEMIKVAREKFWDSKNNWQSLCKRHHDIKTAKEDGGFRGIKNQKRGGGG